MNSNKASIKHIYIDGQEILFINKEDWLTLRLHPFIDDMPLAIVDLLWPTLDFVQNYPELHLGLGFISIFKKWMPYIFIEIQSNFQRVHLETLKCSYCGWQGKTANPMVIDPYIGDGINQNHFIENENCSEISCAFLSKI